MNLTRPYQRALAAFAALTLLASACSNQPAPTAAPLPTATPVPAMPTPLPPKPTVAYIAVNTNEVSPIIVARSPENGERLSPAGAIKLVFDRAMNQDSVAGALQITPKVAGKLSWTNARTATFTPNAALPRNAVFDVALTQDAKAQDGARLSAPYQFRLTTQGNLEVGQTIPADGANEVDPDTRITVLFNRPVVPLTTIAQQASLPQPLSCAPAIEGTQEWLNTSILVLKPVKPFPGGTQFACKVAGDLKDTDGNPMAGEFAFAFGTAAPKVISYSPQPQDDYRGGQTRSRVDTAITVQFNQPVDLASAQAAFALSTVRIGAQAVAGAYAINGSTLTFTPSQKLSFNETYVIRVAAGVLSASGGVGSKDAFEGRFQTVPLPQVIGTQPRNGERAADPYTPFSIQFNTDIDPATVMPHVTFTPAISPTQVYTYFDTYNKTFVIGFNAQPATDYAVKIAPGIADPYGNTTQETLEVKFRTGNAPPQASIAMPYGAATFNANQPVRVVATTMNVNTLNFEMYRFERMEDMQELTYRYDVAPPAANLFRKFAQQTEAPSNKTAKVLVNLGEGEGKLAPGMYLLNVTSPEIPSRFVQRAMIFVSEINLTLKSEPDNALVWATDLNSGQPINNLQLDFFTTTYNNEKQRNEFKLLGTSATNAQGIASFKNEGGAEMPVAFVIARNPFSAVSAEWGNGFRIFDFGIGLPGYYGGDETLRGFVYTDRPIYRPGQKVLGKGVVRNEDDVKFSLPTAGAQIQIDVRDPNGNVALSKQDKLDEFGAFNFEVDLPEGAALGGYYVQVLVAGRPIAPSSFTVAAYRPPEFEVSVEPGATEIVRGTTLTATVKANYLSGGALRNAKVNWNVLVSRASFNPPQLDDYTFSDNDDPWRCFDCWFSQRNDPPPQPLFSGEGTTNERGELALTLPISLELRDYQGQIISGPVQLSIEANATGADNQVIAGRASVTAHPANYYLGIATNQYLIQEKKPMTIEVISVDTQGARLAGKGFEVSVYRREWKSSFVGDDGDTSLGGRWETEVNDELITQTTVTSNDKALAFVPFVAPKAGSYHIVARGADGDRVVQSSRFVWVTGPDYVPWFRENNDRVNLIANKSSYLPGETATILIPSPFIDDKIKEHLALVTIERGHVLKHEVIKVTSSSQTVAIPITKDFAPNVFVSVVLMKGAAPTPSPSPVGTGEGSRAEFKVGYIGLKVEPVKQVISVTLTPDQKLSEPGKAVSYAVLATDADGKPVSAQFSLDLVDKGILNLLPRTKDEIVEAFYGLRNSRVNTAVGLSISGNRVTEEQVQQGGLNRGRNVAFDSAGGAAPAAPAATTAAPAQEMAVAKAETRQQEGNAPQVRQNFADTAFWSPSIATDAEGKANVTITLPDNLTTWVLRAVGIDGETKVGEGVVNVVATKPLLIRPVTPRFLVVGDVVELGAVVNNNTESEQTATVSLQAQGVTLAQSPSTEQSVTLPPNGEARVNWVVTTTDVPAVDLVFTVQNAQYSDASKPRLATAPNGGLKVNKWSAPEVVGTAGDLTEEGARTEVIGLPPEIDTTQGAVTLRLDPSLAASMQAGLTYLETFPYECAEQVTSKFLPNVLTYRALKELGIQNPELEAKLPDLVNKSLSRLYEIQNEDGGWGWWRGEGSNPNISTYVVFGMLKAREAGFEVSVDALQRGLQYVQGQLVSVRVESAYYELNQQAYKLYVLAEAGQNETAKLSELFELRSKLSHFGKALLALAIGKADKNDARIKTLFADLNAAVIQSATGAHWEEQNVDWWAMNSDTRTTALVLDAFAQLDPNSKLIPNIVRWLMVARNAEGFWRSTQETAWSLIALTDWMRVTNELKGNYPYGAFLNDKPVAEAQASPATITQTTFVTLPVAALLRDVGNRLTISRGPGEGRLYYTAHLKAYLPVPSIKAADRGIAVQRRYVLASCANGVKCPEVTSAKVGDVIRVELTIIAPSDLHYVQLEDPLPAGAEAIDTGLATTSQLAASAELRASSDEENSSFGPRYSSFRWWWNWYSRSELRDDRVALFATFLSKGSYEYSYTMRVTSAGQFNVIPTFVNEQYFPEVFGRSDGRLLSVTK